MQNLTAIWLIGGSAVPMVCGLLFWQRRQMSSTFIGAAIGLAAAGLFIAVTMM